MRRQVTCYPMHGTDVQYGAMVLLPGARYRHQVSYAMSSPDMPYGTIRLCSCYAVSVSGTDVPYGATREKLPMQR
eukprot:1026463-Rhodomonas_salina.1